MSDDLKRYWSLLDGMPRKDVLQMAEEEMLDVKGLSIVRNILYKYNLTHVSIDHKLRFAFKRSVKDNPRKEIEQGEQGKD